ncbi:hypothetical protein [Variovorax sp. Sphag1AA]|uniref:hypothetical protein n=1 Tax=Variovorax sp. Sphag1AA TaxID=2587027 RepID=UPI00160AE271|nr:hypothetical protein [Variovorax sp. Sphag1AA]MBB3180277.1 hypothetical protein [Variovorax sp. Sphag1AA]
MKVIDGAIRNALVFLDLNNNGQLDAGEPSARTDATGQAILDVSPADSAKAPVVAAVGTDAIDADTGPVPVAFSLSAPPGRSSVVSPLTTLVNQILRDTGVSADEAEASARAQVGLGVSLFSDFTADSSAANRAAAVNARLLVLIAQQQLGQLASLKGRTDLSGATISDADLRTAVHRELLDMLASVSRATQESTIQSACAEGPGSSACEAALQTQVTSIVATNGMTVESAPALIAAGRAPDTGTKDSPNPQASASISFLKFIEANYYASYGGFLATAQENTPDASGLVRFRGVQRNYQAGTLFEGGLHGNGMTALAPQMLHWNGSGWAECLSSTQSIESQRDASGRSAYVNYCDNLMTGSSQRSAVDISGKKMNEVLAAISPVVPSTALWAGPGWATLPNDLGAKGSAVFPAGSKLQLQTTVITATSPVVYSTGNFTPRFSAAVAAGGDTREGGAPACLSADADASAAVGVTSFDELLAYFRGTPCVYNQRSITSSDGSVYYGTAVDEDWTFSAFALAGLGSESAVSNPTAYYTTNTIIAASFPAESGSVVAYHSCRQRQLPVLSIRNCVPIGRGTYEIETLGDARVMRLKNLPLQLSGIGAERVFVERAGAVYTGQKSKPGLARETQLNLTAANALFSLIGVPAIVP